ncbi:isopeptide-forming domain-containing fimbrial protein [Carnobacterium maltaromaticum]|uniref:isopeptide-forming domain-containing fimbrial protein n=1 Tax=Carnobacterium maltaromaticum TaxID=2751 RepID=UPI00295F170C|nr:isopeptide-forming domain-containing fimbrial protein [Carnobacterium maltaromaticum]
MLKKLTKILLVSIFFSGSTLGVFTQKALAELIVVDKDNPAINATNNLVVEMNPERKGFKVETNTGSRAKIYSKDENAPLNASSSDYISEENFKTKIAPNYVKGYGSTAVALHDVKNTDTVTVTYNNVGNYNKKPVKAIATYSNIKYVDAPTDYDYPMIDISENLFSGNIFFNVGSFNYDLEFRLAETDEVIEFNKDAYIGINSLNMGEFADYSKSNENNVYITNDSLVKYQGVAAATSVSGDYWRGSSNDFIDKIGSENFKKATVSFQISGKKQSFTLGSEHGSAWMSISSATLFSVEPEKPTKTVVNTQGKDINKVQVQHGQTIAYLINQKINTLGQDLLEKYSQFVIEDPLPENVTFVSAEIVDEKGTIVPNAGTIDFDDKSNKVTFKANENMLKNVMQYTGETYSLKITVKVK